MQTAVAADIALPAANGFTGTQVTLAGTFNGENYDEDITLTSGDTAEEIATAINSSTDTTGITATAVTKAKLDPVAGGATSFTLNGTVIAATVDATDLTTLVSAINEKSAATGITAEFGTDKTSLIMTSAVGDDIEISDYINSSVVADATVATFAGGLADGTFSVAQNLLYDTTAADSDDSSRVGGYVILDSTETFTATWNSATMTGATTTAASSLEKISDVSVSTQANANDAISVIDGAISKIDSMRGGLGAIQNRFESTIANLSNVAENLSAARSRILDADIAQETSAMTKNNILQQAGVSILAQANQAPQLALSLLG
jgi:flagellin